jgi:hypothetical protein
MSETVKFNEVENRKCCIVLQHLLSLLYDKKNKDVRWLL